MTTSRDTLGGWYPSADPIAIPAANFAHGYASREAVVLHIIVGTQASARQKFQTPTSETSAHFSISKTGHVEQYVSVLDTAYANGLRWDGAHWIDPEKIILGVGGKPAPSWAKLKPPTNPNWQTISIEHEGQPADIPTVAMESARIALLRWLGQQFPTLRLYAPRITLIGHSEISPVSRPNCPGPHVDFAQVAAAASGHGVYAIDGVPIYNDSQCTRFSGRVLPSGATVRIDRLAAEQPADYAPGAAHVSDLDGGGFIRLDGQAQI